LCEALLSGRGEASGTAMAREVLDHYRNLDEAGRLSFFETLTRDFGPDREKLAEAIEAWRAQRPTLTASDLSLCLRTAAAGIDPSAQPRPGRHQRAGRHARRSAWRHEWPQGPCRARPRRRCICCLLVNRDSSCCAG